MTEPIPGTIIRSSGGFYTVGAGGAELECRARGIFRKEGFKPCVGDNVVCSLNEDGSGSVDEVLPRRNSLVRPPLANLDAMVLVLSVSDPEPNYFVADKFIAVLEHEGIEPLVAVTKPDLSDAGPLCAVYENAGFTVVLVNRDTAEGIPELLEQLKGRFTAFSGNSGVGKTSLLNALDSRLGLAVGETSRKLGRGRHTTRTVTAFTLRNGGRVADTPGFSSLDVLQASSLAKEDLAGCFREFAPYVGSCRFKDCTHTVEAGCGVLAALAEGKIAPSRHTSYRLLYDQIKDIKEWERR
jgi:ribosome biogenesis GTPase